MTRSKRTIALAVTAAVGAFAIGAAAIPRPPALSQQTSGDAALLTEVRGLLADSPGVRDRLSVAVIDGETVRTAHFGASDDTEFEIGSVTKTITASLLADAIDRGEVEAQTPLGELLPLGSSPASSVTLEELATQSSGLPRLAMPFDRVVSSIVANYRAGDPYGSTVDELVADAREQEVGEKRYLYSNLGFALLGQGLAAAADTDFPTLAAERVLTPLGMRDSFVPESPDDLGDDAATGFTASGRPADAWTLGADAPAGSARSTLADMTRYLRAQLDGSAPGVAATGPIADAGESSTIGYAWHTTDAVTWHNGGTGGFTSWVGFDRDAGRAVVVLNNTAVSVDELGFALMEVD